MNQTSDKAVRFSIGGPVEQYAERGGAFAKAFAAVEPARDAYRECEAEVVEAGNDSHVSAEGARARAEAAIGQLRRTLAEHERIHKARQAIKARLHELSGQDKHKAPVSDHDLAVASDIRARIARSEQPFATARQHLKDQTVMAAILAAHPLASGLTEKQHTDLAQLAAHEANPAGTDEALALEKAQEMMEIAFRSAERMAQQTTAAAQRQAA